VLCQHTAFMSPESCSEAGKPRHLCDNRDPINQGRAWFLFLLKMYTNMFHITTVTQMIMIYIIY